MVFDVLGKEHTTAEFRALQRQAAERYRDAHIINPHSPPVSEADSELTWYWLSYMADVVSWRQVGDRWSRTDWDRHTLLVDTMHTALLQARRRVQTSTLNSNNKLTLNHTWVDVEPVVKDGVIINKAEALREPIIVAEKLIYVKAPLITYVDIKYQGWDLYTQEEFFYLAGLHRGKRVPMTEKYPKLYNFLVSIALQRYTWLRASYHYAEHDYSEALRLYTTYRLHRWHSVHKDSEMPSNFRLTEAELEWFRDTFTRYHLLVGVANGKDITAAKQDAMAAIANDREQDIITRVGGYFRV